MESALAFLGMIDPEAFEIALTAATPPVGEIPRTRSLSRSAATSVRRSGSSSPRAAVTALPR
jgi:hypothetical protein